MFCTQDCVCNVRSPVQVSYLNMEEHVDGDPCKFVLLCRGSSERLTLQAANIDIKKEWVQSIRQLLDMQIDFLTGERNLNRDEVNDEVNEMRRTDGIHSFVFSFCVGDQLSRILRIM